MEEIEVGECVRTKDGIIAKITYVDSIMIDCDRDVFDLENLAMMEIPIEYAKEYIVKHSKNITDLIEEGDFVNGFPVMEPVYNGNVWWGVDEGYEHFKRAFGDIKTILTKEQYNANCYRLEEI